MWNFLVSKTISFFKTVSEMLWNFYDTCYVFFEGEQILKTGFTRWGLGRAKSHVDLTANDLLYQVVFQIFNFSGYLIL